MCLVIHFEMSLKQHKHTSSCNAKNITYARATNKSQKLLTLAKKYSHIQTTRDMNNTIMHSIILTTIFKSTS